MTFLNPDTVRPSMTELIDFVRRLISDPSVGTTPTWTDSQIQDILDVNRQDYSELELVPEDYVDPTTHDIFWYNFFAPWGYWESDAIIQNYTWAEVTPDNESDWLVGRWSWNESQQLPMRITGKAYDVYAAAADMLEQWAASFMMAYDISTDMQVFKRSQISKQMLELAHLYRRRTSITVMHTYRSDMRQEGAVQRWLDG